jgi:hypothetical protein
LNQHTRAASHSSCSTRDLPGRGRPVSRLLLDAGGRVFAASDRQGLLSERLQLRTEGRDSGFYTDGDAVVGFARTPGYETYEGLGWYGAIVQRRISAGP